MLTENTTCVFLSYYPLKQGLKPCHCVTNPWLTNIFILLSIKTRIETIVFVAVQMGIRIFISYYPLKQGLKPLRFRNARSQAPGFISYYPLKQGLKPSDDVLRAIPVGIFISYYPLKQGLKRDAYWLAI